MNFATVLRRLEKLENPYPGLRPFETSEAHLFFGRDQQVSELVARLERNRFVAVVGVSGSGKSSLVRAGLIPAAERGRMSDSRCRWRVVVTRPAGAPFTSLATNLKQAGFDPATLRQSSYGLIHVAQQLPANGRLLLLVDQFEEMFRYKDLVPTTAEARLKREQVSAEAHDFVQVLLAASRYPSPVYVVITMRSDYLGDCAEFRDLPEALNESQYLIPRLTREQRRQAIEYPLRGAGIDPALVQRMLNDAGDEPDQLPILQHALMRTWSHWYESSSDHKRKIGLVDYEAIGGFNKALDHHASELLKHVRSDHAATIFKRLTARGRNSRERRDPATLSELWALCRATNKEERATVTAVVNEFRQREATFLLPRDGTLRPDTSIDITHESLIRQWEVLRDHWLPKEMESAKTFLDLAQRARNWRSRGTSLLTGVDLADALQWAEQSNPTTTWAEHYADEQAQIDVMQFIKASQENTSMDMQAVLKRYQQELAIAAELQQRMMTVTVPDVPYARVNAVCYQKKEVGGDFFDLIYTEAGLAFVVADVSGTGISAAVVASTLQGMLYSQLARDSPLPEMMASVNRFLCEKIGGQKYAVVLVARLMPDGELEILNAGGVPPLLVSGGTVTRHEEGALPVGLVPAAHFPVSRVRLQPGDRFLVVTDGVAEAENSQGEFFGTERLEAASVGGFAAIESALEEYRGSTPLTDDWTMVEVIYRGQTPPR